jgi:hypothetical protein
MITTHHLGEIPNDPAVYGLWAGRERHAYCVYVGITDTLRRRLIQHLVTRDSSIVTGAAAATLRPELVTEVRWWCHRRFKNDTWRAAAEIVASTVLFPTLRSRGKPPRDAMELADSQEFRDEMTILFENAPTGQFKIPNLTLVGDHVATLADRLKALEARVAALEDGHIPTGSRVRRGKGGS